MLAETWPECETGAPSSCGDWGEDWGSKRHSPVFSRWEPRYGRTVECFFFVVGHGLRLLSDIRRKLILPKRSIVTPALPSRATR